MIRNVYVDNASTTKISNIALSAMMPYLTEQFGNPSSIHSCGRYAKQTIENARVKIAKSIGAKSNEIYFTSGGTESNNWAIKVIAEQKKQKGKHIITSEIEHNAVLNTLNYLEKNGYEVTYLKVNHFGQISLTDLKNTIRDDTILITIMTANNEIGTILPITEIGNIAKENDIIFHTDAVQAIGHIPINVDQMNIDMLSMSGHKFGGPKGIGALYVKKSIKLSPFLHGGGQERGMRSGTENVANIVGLASALDDSVKYMSQNIEKITAMRDRLIKEILKIPYSMLTGDHINRLPGTASFIFKDIESESLILLLDKYGIYASASSACNSGSIKPSHVLTAIGENSQGSLRLTINKNTTDEDINYILEKVPLVIKQLRNI